MVFKTYTYNNIIETKLDELCMYLGLHTHTYTCTLSHVVNKTKEKEAMNLKEDRGLDMGGLRGIKGKEEMMQ